MRVLIVEDTIERQRFLRDLFSAHECYFADNATSAIDILGELDIMIVMLDYDLAADTRGTDVARYIASSSEDESTVIVHSANPDGVASILQILPQAMVFPVQSMIKSNPLYTQLRRKLATGENVDLSFLVRAT